MLSFTIIASILIGALSSFTLSVIGLFVLSGLLALALFLGPTEAQFSPAESAAALLALQVSYLASGWLQSFLRIRRRSDQR